MAVLSPAWVQVHPSYIVPEALLQYQQVSGAFDLLAGSDPMVRLGDGDLLVYVKKFDIRTKTASGNSAYNSLPSVSIIPSMISTPTYLVRVRAEYDHHDTAAAGNWGFTVVDAQRHGMRQGIFQSMRNALLYGFNAANGEGLINTNGATAVSLPADTNSNTTVVTYDNGQMATFLLTQISTIKSRTMQLGTPVRIVICGPQRTLGAFEYQNIVQITSYQRRGGGSASTAGTVKEVAEMNGDQIDWVYDDTLLGKGSGGTDAVVISMPEVKKPMGNKINTNEFAKLSPGLEACNLQLCDMAAPREIPTPLAGGAIDVLSELRITSGWGLRPENTTIVSMQYS